MKMTNRLKLVSVTFYKIQYINSNSTHISKFKRCIKITNNLSCRREELSKHGWVNIFNDKTCLKTVISWRKNQCSVFAVATVSKGINKLRQRETVIRTAWIALWGYNVVFLTGNEAKTDKNKIHGKHLHRFALLELSWAIVWIDNKAVGGLL